MKLRSHRAMAKPLTGLLLGLAAAFGISQPAFSAQQLPTYNGKPYHPGELIVRYREGNEVSKSAFWLQSLGAKSIKRFADLQRMQNFSSLQTGRMSAAAERFSRVLHVRLNQGDDTMSAMERFQADPRVEYVEPNYELKALVTPNDTTYTSQWYLHNTGASGGTADVDIDAPEAWDIERGSNQIVVAVIDTGVEYTHPDLNANMWRNENEIPNNNIDDDDNGYVDDIYGYDFGSGDNNPLDGNGHGTHVSGTIAAVTNNGLGVAGISWNSRIMALKFLDDSGSGSTSSAIKAIYYAADNGAKIINASWGGPGRSSALEDAIEYARDKDVLFVAAAGNEGINNDTSFSRNYPSSHPTANIISVAATDSQDRMPSFSNFGVTTVDVGAPGVSIRNLWLNSSYKSISGTSMATPVVAGIASVLWAQKPERTYAQIKDLILKTAEPVASLNGKTVTGARVNLLSALKFDLTPPTPEPPPVTPPPVEPPTVPPQPVNNAPIANAGADLMASYGNTVQLNAAGSSDPDGDMLTFSWRQTAGVQVTLSGATTNSVQFAAPFSWAQSTLTFEVTVNDGKGGVATDTVDVVIRPFYYGWFWF